MQNVLIKKSMIIITIVLLFGMLIFPNVSGNISTITKNQKNIINNNFQNYEERVYSNNNKINPLPWWDRWPDFPGRFEPFFDVNDIKDFGQTAYGLASGNFNNDELLDFIVSWRYDNSFQGGITLFLNNGDGTFSESFISTIEDLPLNDPYPDDEVVPTIMDLDAEDFDNDGDVDLLIVYSEYEWSGNLPVKTNGTGFVLFNNGMNQFESWNTAFWHKDRINPEVATDDFDNDGDVDFIVGDNSGQVSYYSNDGTGDFTFVCTTDFNGDLSWGVAGADFDNDGDVDFIATQKDIGWSGHIYLCWNDGTTSCFDHSDYIQVADTPPVDRIMSLGPSDTGCLSSIDYNDDGKMDFLFGGRGNVYLYVQKEIGVFEYISVCRFPGIKAEDDGWYHDCMRGGGMCVGDFNGDGLDDAVTGGVQGIVRIFINDYILVDIIYPDTALFIRSGEILFWGLPIYSFLEHGIAFVIGDLKVVAVGLEPLKKVEFYLDGNLEQIDEAEPYEWMWDRFSFGRHIVKALAYNLDGEQVGFDEAIVWKLM
jgi:hypothetical protein